METINKPKYIIGDVVLVRDFVRLAEFFAQMKITDARYLVDNGYWEYRSHIGAKDVSDWYREDRIIEKL